MSIERYNFIDQKSKVCRAVNIRARHQDFQEGDLRSYSKPNEHSADKSLSKQPERINLAKQRPFSALSLFSLSFYDVYDRRIFDQLAKKELNEDPS